MSKQAKHFYQFDSFVVDENERVLLRDGKPVPLPPKVFETLLALIQASGHIVEKDALIQKVWPDTFVEENSLSQYISILRKTLGDERREQRYIETVPRRGYRFVAVVKELWDGDTVSATQTRVSLVIREEQEKEEPETRQGGLLNSAKARTAREAAVRLSADGSQSPTRVISGFKDRRALTILGFAGLAIALAGSGFLLSKFVGRKQEPSMTIRKLTNNGKIYHGVISPDGKNVAYKLVESGQSSLWLKNLPTASDVQIVPPSEAAYGMLAFSPDSNYLYFNRTDKREPNGALYRMPTVGGQLSRLTDAVNSPVTFSPDGARLAFVRNSLLPKLESSLMLANADGTGERKLPISNRYSLGFPSWSPDGKTIACAFTNVDEQGHFAEVVEVGVPDGTEKAMPGRWGTIRQIAWLPEGHGLLILARERTGDSLQIWHLSYPGGQARRVTNDLNSYTELSVTLDSRALVTVQQELRRTIVTAEPGNTARIKQIEFGGDNSDGTFGLSWTPEHRLVYVATLGGNADIWIMDSDGRNRTKLTSTPELEAWPIVSPDGRSIVFTRSSGIQNIWRMDIDGGNQRRLTNGKIDAGSSISPDGKWVVYSNSDSGKMVLRKVSIEGGDSTQLTNQISEWPSISPDGKLIACVHADEHTQPPQMKLAVFPFEGGEPVKIFDAPKIRGTVIRWSRDSKAVFYSSNNSAGTYDILIQPVDGEPLRQLISLSSDAPVNFDSSRDGKLVMLKASASRDLVLINNFL